MAALEAAVAALEALEALEVLLPAPPQPVLQAPTVQRISQAHWRLYWVLGLPSSILDRYICHIRTEDAMESSFCDIAFSLVRFRSWTWDHH